MRHKERYKVADITCCYLFIVRRRRTGKEATRKANTTGEMEFKASQFIIYIIALSYFCTLPLFASHSKEVKYVSAVINASYKELDRLKYIEIWRHITGEGIYGIGASVSPATGYVYYIKGEDWCKPVSKQIPNVLKPWIALIERGNCKFDTKIHNAMKANASAVIIFDNASDTLDKTPMRCYGVGNIVAISIPSELGLELASIFQKSVIHMYISIGRYHYGRRTSWEAGKTSVLFVLVSFILLMCISLAWLVFYYVQRFRYFYARDKKEKQLVSAAKKAISKLKTRMCDTDSDESQDDTCAVCLEGYGKGETLRVLTCRHEFHKSCVDPWLLEHRTCPICKTNILKACGINDPETVTSERDVEVPSVPQPMGIVLEVQEHQEALENGHSIDSIHNRLDGEGIANSLACESMASTDEEDSLANSTSVLVTQEYA